MQIHLKINFHFKIGPMQGSHTRWTEDKVPQTYVSSSIIHYNNKKSKNLPGDQLLHIAFRILSSRNLGFADRESNY